MDGVDSGVQRAPVRASGVSREELEALWHELEELRSAYFRAAPKPCERLDRARRGLSALDACSFLPQHPHAQGIIDCALLELAQWEETWPGVPGCTVAPSSFGALVLVHGYA
jgi:hypothetical protein